MPVVRRGLPEAAAPFIGRASALDLITRADGTVAISGMPGSGKTQLAVHALMALHRDGRVREILSIDLRDDVRTGALRARDVANAIAHVLDEPADARLREHEFLSAVATAVDRRGVGLLFDDVTDMRAIEPFTRLLKTPVIIVCRSRVDPHPGLRVVEATPWSDRDTETYLRERIGHDLYDAEPEAARELAASTGGLPLAAKLLAARIRHRPRWRLEGHLDEWRERQDPLPDALEASIRLSYTALAPATARAIRLVSATPCSGMEIGAVVVLLDTDQKTAGRHIRTLESAQLIESGAPLTLHPIVRVFASARSNEQDTPAERREAVDRLVDHLIETAWSAMAACYPSAFGRSERADHAVEACTKEEGAEFWRTQLTTVLDLSAAVADRRPHVAVAVSEAVAHHLDVEGRHLLAEHVHRTGLRCAERMGDLHAVAACAHRVSQSLVRLGSPYAKSELLRAQQLARQADSSVFVLKVSNTLAVLAAQEGDFEGAALRFTEALEAAERGQLTDMLAGLHDNLGIVLRRVGDLEGARDRHRHANRLAAQRGDGIMAGLALGNLADVEVAMGDFTAAARSAREAAALTADQAGLPHAYALTNLALALTGLGDATGAEENHRAALEQAESMADATLIASVRNNLSELWLRTGRRAEAAAGFAASLGIAEQNGVVHEQARAFAGLGECHLDAEEWDLARARLTAASEILGESTGAEAERVRDLLQRLDGLSSEVDATAGVEPATPSGMNWSPGPPGSPR